MFSQSTYSSQYVKIGNHLILFVTYIYPLPIYLYIIYVSIILLCIMSYRRLYDSVRVEDLKSVNIRYTNICIYSAQYLRINFGYFRF